MRWQAVPQKDEMFSSVSGFKISENGEEFFFAHVAFGEPSERRRSFRLCVETSHSGGGNSPPPASRTNDGRLSLDSPTVNNMGFVGKAGFVKKAEDYAVSEALFLICGQISRVQVRMAFSSRSTALFAGFWQEKPSRFKRCQTLRSS